MEQAPLDYITIRGFRSIKAVEKLELRPINVVIGPNGSGKSNLISAFGFLHAIRAGKLQDYVGTAGGADALLHFGSKITTEIFLAISFRGGLNQYEIHLTSTTDDQLLPTEEIAYFWKKDNYSRPYQEPLSRVGMEAGISAPSTLQIVNWVKIRLGLWRVYHFHDTSASSPMKKTADIDDNRFFRPDGSNLAAFLYYLQKVHPDIYGLIVKTIQRVTPFFDGFQLRPSQLNKSKIKLEWAHKGSDKYFSAASFSDGTLRFICLATLFLQPEELRPSVIVVDEPELGLHPVAITMLASMIKAVAATAKTQVIISTQSSLLLDHFEPEDVLVAQRQENGTVFKRLDNSALAEWLEDYSLGQLWEKNEFGGRPQHG